MTCREVIVRQATSQGEGPKPGGQRGEMERELSLGERAGRD